MADTPDRSRGRAERDQDDDDAGTEESHWDTGSLLTGLVLGAVLGAGAALLFAPQSGEKTRRQLVHRGRGLQRDAERKFIAVKKEARKAVRHRKEALLERMNDGLDRLEERLGE